VKPIDFAARWTSPVRSSNNPLEFASKGIGPGKLSLNERARQFLQIMTPVLKEKEVDLLINIIDDVKRQVHQVQVSHLLILSVCLYQTRTN
jgi:hypothetical protein